MNDTHTWGDTLTDAIKPIVTLGVMAVFCAGFLMHIIPADPFIVVASMITAFWFGKSDSNAATNAATTAAVSAVQDVMSKDPMSGDAVRPVGFSPTRGRVRSTH